MTNRTHLPIIPNSILRRHHVHEPLDHRFRAAARLLQSLWRIKQGLPMGQYALRSGTKRRLGSRIAEREAAAGANFLSPDIALLARREVAYREVGALYDEHRLWTNLLSSMPLTFNTFGPLRLDLDLATRMIRALCRDLVDATVIAILFEHAPGRGEAGRTGDHTAWDAAINYQRANGRRGFLAIEVKYSEAMTEAARELSPHYAKLAAESGLYRDPAAEALQRGGLQQLYREHVLAYATVAHGDEYDEGRFIVLAPALNRPVQKAIRAYTKQLAEPASDTIGFEHWTLEAFVDQMRACGAEVYADKLHERYLDWNTVDRELEAAFAVAGQIVKPANDNGRRNRPIAA